MSDTVTDVTTITLTGTGYQDDVETKVMRQPLPHDHEQAVLDISGEKLAIVIGITFLFILLLLLSLICIFYLMGFMQNVFGYSWSRPMGRTFSTVHSNHSTSSQDIVLDINSNICEKPNANTLPLPMNTAIQPDQCYMCTAIACNANALSSHHQMPNGNGRSC